jgi:hypothetical protein
VQRHFVALLAAVKSSEKVGPEHGLEKVDASGASNSPCGHAFVSLQTLVKPHGAASKIRAGKLSPREVSAALAQAERDSKSVPSRASAKPHAKEQVPKELGVAAENEGFSVAQFLVGSPVHGERGASEVRRVSQAQSVGAAVGLEDLLGFSPASPTPRVSGKAVRHLAEMLVENRFRSCILSPLHVDDVVRVGNGSEGCGRREGGCREGRSGCTPRRRCGMWSMCGVVLTASGGSRVIWWSWMVMLVRSEGWFGSGNGRFATKVGWDGGGREWAAAGGSGTGVLGLHIPSKGRGVPKKRPASDPSKAPKAKAAKTAKSDTKKGAAEGTGDEASRASGVNGEDSSVTGGGDVEPNVTETVGGAGSGRKSGIKKAKKKAPNSAPSTSPGGSGGLDLNIQQPSSPVPDGKGSKSGKKSSPGVGSAGAPKSAQKTEKEKSAKKGASQSEQATDSQAGAGRRAGSGISGGGSLVGRDANGGSTRGEAPGARGIDLNGSSEDDVTIVGVSGGKRLDLFESPVAGPGRRSKASRHATERSEMAGPTRPNLAAYRGDVEERSFPALSSSGVGFGALHSEDSSLASQLSRLSGSSGPDVLSLGVPEGLSQVQWPAAAGAWVPSLSDLDLSRDFSVDPASLSFSDSRQRPSGARSPVRGSPPGQEAGRSLGMGPSPTVTRLQSSEGATRSGNVQEEGGQAPAWMLERQDRGAPNSQSQSQGAGRGSRVAGGSDPSRAVLRLGPTGPVRAALASGGSALQQAHSRPPSHSTAGASHSGRRPPSLSPQMYQGGAFAGVAAQPASGPESPVDTGLALSLGSGAQQKQAGPRGGRDAQPHPSSGR